MENVLFKQIQIDVINQCNLRCPFCLIDHNEFPETQTITDELFDSILNLLPFLVGDLGLSCRFEPFMNKRFLDLIDRVPLEHRGKIFFTSNMTIPLSDEKIERLTKAGLGRIQVSMDSLDPDVFPLLRVNGKFEIFSSNLERLAQALIRNNSPTKLEFITVLNKLNKDDIPDMVRASYERYGANSVEIREIRPVEIHAEWLAKHNTDERDWEELVQAMEAQEYACLLKPNRSWEESMAKGKSSYATIRIPGKKGKLTPALLERLSTPMRGAPNSMHLHMHSFGKANVKSTYRGKAGGLLNFNFEDIPDVVGYLRNHYNDWVKTLENEVSKTASV